MSVPEMALMWAINYSDPTKGFAVLNTNVIKYSHFINNSWQDIKTIRWFPQIEINTSDPERVYFADDSVYTEKKWHTNSAWRRKKLMGTTR